MNIICKICQKEYKNLSGLGVHIKITHQMSTKEYYDKYIQINPNKCKICGNLTQFVNMNTGYRPFCSRKCQASDPDVKRKRIANTNYNQIHEKSKITNILKYGGENPMCSEIVKNKIKTTNLKKHGVEHVLQNKEIYNKFQQTMIETYGVNHPSKNTTIQKKKEEYFLKKYQSISPFGSKEIQEKSKQTLFQNYGVDNPLANEDIQNKFKKTCLEIYGVDNPSKIFKIQKQIQTKLLHLGYLKIIEKFPQYHPMFTINEYKGCGYTYKWKCQNCQTIFEGRFSNRYILFCPQCEPQKKYHAQHEIYQFLCQYIPSIEIIQNSRKIIIDRELDFYIPSLNLAIEYNGNYWHSEIFGQKDRQYHLQKTILTEKENINLIQICEDEWLFKKKIIKSLIKYRLKKIKYKIFARNCEIKKIDTQLKNKFLNKYHIQGEDKSSVHLGAFFRNRLVSVMTFKKFIENQKDYELSRFCMINNFTIAGIANKLLKYFETTIQPNSIVTYADRRWSKGNVYYQMGFTLKHINPPNYWYTKNYLERIHRFNFRKKHLISKLQHYDSNLSEWENMKANGYDRIWDCGNLVFIKNYQNDKK